MSVMMMRTSPAETGPFSLPTASGRAVRKTTVLVRSGSLVTCQSWDAGKKDGSGSGRKLADEKLPTHRGIDTMNMSSTIPPTVFFSFFVACGLRPTLSKQTLFIPRPATETGKGGDDYKFSAVLPDVMDSATGYPECTKAITKS